MSNDILIVKDMAVGVLNIKTVTNVCPLIAEYSNTNAELKDIIDEYGLPYISARLIRLALFQEVDRAYKNDSIDDTEYKLLKELLHNNFSFSFNSDYNMTLSDACLDNYVSYLKELSNIDNSFAKLKSNISEIFVDFINIKYKGKKLKVVTFKPGLNFSALIRVHKKYYQTLTKLVSITSRVGQYQNKNIGKVYLDIAWVQDRQYFDYARNNINHEINDQVFNIKSSASGYSRLDYSIRCVSGLSSKWSLTEDVQAPDYIDGMHIFSRIKSSIFCDVSEKELKEKLICSNAYLSIKNKRATPNPSSFMVEKLNKSVIKDRSIIGCERSGDKFVQFQNLDGGYSIDQDSEIVHSSKPIMYNTYVEFFDMSNKSKIKPYEINVIAPQQVFKGYIQGPTKYIKKIYKHIISQRLFQIGLFGNVGLGISLLTIDGITPISKQSPNLVSEFVLKCNSAIKLWNVNGMYSTDVNDLTAEIYKKYKIKNQLIVVNQFKKVCKISSLDSRRFFIGNAQQAIDAGSVFYIKVKDGMVDLNKINDMFIGHENHFGFGEIKCYPAKKIPRKKMVKVIEENNWYPKQNSTNIFEMIKFRNNLLFNTFFKYIDNEAKYKKLDDLTKNIKSSPIPKEKLLKIRDKASVQIDDETIFEYYQRVYQETEHE